MDSPRRSPGPFWPDVPLDVPLSQLSTQPLEDDDVPDHLSDDDEDNDGDYIGAKSSRVRRVAFTWNLKSNDNLSAESASAVELLSSHYPDDFKYLCFQFERSPAASHLHIQGYFELHTQARWNKIKKWFPTMHFGQARKPKAANRAYCSKKKTAIRGTFQEFGEPSKGQGFRQDLEDCKETIDSGALEVDIWDQHFSTVRCVVVFLRFSLSVSLYVVQMVRNHKALMHYKVLKDRQKAQKAGFQPPQVIVLWGPPGTGKSRKARELTADAPTATVNLTGTASAPSWWDSYAGEPNVIIDDFEDSQLSRTRFCQIFDGYPCDLGIKGSHVIRAFRKVIITSNMDPAKWYYGDKSVQRRITRSEEFFALDDISEEDAAALDM